MPATKELVLGGPGSGKTTYLASRALEPGSLSIDPVGQLRRLVVGNVDVVAYDRHTLETFDWLKGRVEQHERSRRPLLIDVSMLRPAERGQFSDEFGLWLREAKRNGTLILDEVQWLVPVGTGSEHGLVEFIGKCRNYGVSVVVTAHRGARTNKDIAGLCDTFRVGRMTHPLDLEASTRLLQSQVSARGLDEMAARLPTLKPGEWYVLRGAAPGGD